jgi:2',3'-cyclic-nucleotide 2'-phosphodiesterase (5'-nucleotidase family)
MRYEARVKRARLSAALFSVLAVAASAAACNGCRPSNLSGADASAERPTLRLYLVSNVAGALEPCGCVKDQLGGLDHVAALVTQGRKTAPDAAFVAAGPLFFLDPVLKKERQSQERAKAETIADVIKGIDFVGFAPGRNDFALGDTVLSELTTRSGGEALACNTKASAIFHASMVRVIDGVKIGFVGIAQPDQSDIGAPLTMTFDPPAAAVKTEIAALKSQGAQVLVAIAATGRGEAKRIADVNPELTAVLVGATSMNGEENTDAPPPELVGDVLVAETSNHLQTVAELDLFVRNGSFKFADATGIARGEKRRDLDGRIDELHGKIADWEKDAKIAPADLEARRADLRKLEAARKALDESAPPKEGSFFRYRVVEVRDSLGVDDTVKKEFLAYYKKVDDTNRTLFADRMPPPPGPDGVSYAGIDACVPCHAAPKAVWDKTAHARAYATLANAFKEFNLDCVSCHVTGYEEPGGSSVTHVDKLKNVQCEVCHGPSSKHVADPAHVKPPIPRPGTEKCVSCHHPPHVHSFDAVAKLPEILGPGHGR